MDGSSNVKLWFGLEEDDIDFAISEMQNAFTSSKLISFRQELVGGYKKQAV